MLKMHPQMKFSPEEKAFLCQWIYDEAHFQEGIGPAKRLQLAKGAVPAEISLLIAAGLPDPVDQEAASTAGASVPPPAWPWTLEEFRKKLQEAQATLARRRAG